MATSTTSNEEASKNKLRPSGSFPRARWASLLLLDVALLLLRRRALPPRLRKNEPSLIHLSDTA